MHSVFLLCFVSACATILRYTTTRVFNGPVAFQTDRALFERTDRDVTRIVHENKGSACTRGSVVITSAMRWIVPVAVHQALVDTPEDKQE